ncbi:SH3 domain-containing protein [Bacillus salipaludis]|uniref:SH3 domain-containing protein n=1 Tax=Bacillus salipaludis TaxID=2547811 RepID=A0A4R5VTA1_9BACI|nr:SH3 domain-containing protein [Bacillus salipaludis]TDK62191.1 SH3 domain-containing protein [Bacillus salipaludis]
MKNMGKVRVLVNNTQFWLDNIRFSVYKDCISVLNLGRVAVSSLNVRSGPSTSEGIIGNLYLNQYVQLLLDDEKKLSRTAQRNGSKLNYPMEKLAGRVKPISYKN